MLRLVMLCALISASLTENIDFGVCAKDASANCDISDVTLSPCPNVGPKNACKLKKGTVGTLEFNYIPAFAADKLDAHLFWVAAFEIPLPGMDTNGCHSTTCPTVPGQANHFGYNLTIEPIFPVGKYNVKALLRKDSENQCCFEFTMKIVR